MNNDESVAAGRQRYRGNWPMYCVRQKTYLRLYAVGFCLLSVDTDRVLEEVKPRAVLPNLRFLVHLSVAPNVGRSKVWRHSVQDLSFVAASCPIHIFFCLRRVIVRAVDSEVITAVNKGWTGSNCPRLEITTVMFRERVSRGFDA